VLEWVINTDAAVFSQDETDQFSELIQDEFEAINGIESVDYASFIV